MSQALNVPIAFAAGVASFLSPCVLPLIPGYISMISGMSLRELTAEADRPAVVRKAVFHSALFVGGFSLVFTLLGAFASGLGSPLAANLPWLKKAAGVVIILFGLHTMEVLPITWLYYQKRASFAGFKPGPLGAFLMGAAFAFGWTPCVGPILAAMLALAVEGGVGRGMFLLFAYSLGIGIPFLLTAMGVGAFLKMFQKYKRFIRWGEIAAGALLVGVGILMFTDRFTVLAEFFSFFNRFAL
jgi:cytochrome c-type biogenesis protein